MKNQLIQVSISLHFKQTEMISVWELLSNPGLEINFRYGRSNSPVLPPIEEEGEKVLEWVGN